MVGIGNRASLVAINANIRQDLIPGGRLNAQAHATGFGDRKAIRADAQGYADKQMKKAIKAANNGNMDSALKHLGKGLHAVQDLVAHKDFPNLKENLSRLGEHKSNDEAPSEEDLNQATQDSVNYINKFLDSVGGADAVNQGMTDEEPHKMGGDGRGVFFSDETRAEVDARWNNAKSDRKR